jgi:hypothetical protein
VWQGVYRFDHIHTPHGETVTSPDLLRIGSSASTSPSDEAELSGNTMKTAPTSIVDASSKEPDPPDLHLDRERSSASVHLRP